MECNLIIMQYFRSGCNMFYIFYVSPNPSVVLHALDLKLLFSHYLPHLLEVYRFHFSCCLFLQTYHAKIYEMYPIRRWLNFYFFSWWWVCLIKLVKFACNVNEVTTFSQDYPIGLLHRYELFLLEFCLNHSLFRVMISSSWLPLTT